MKAREVGGFPQFPQFPHLKKMPISMTAITTAPRPAEKAKH